MNLIFLCFFSQENVKIERRGGTKVHCKKHTVFTDVLLSKDWTRATYRNRVYDFELFAQPLNKDLLRCVLSEVCMHI